MADTGEIPIFETEEFEVVDECIDEDEATVAKETPERLTVNSNEIFKIDDPNKSTDVEEVKTPVVKEVKTPAVEEIKTPAVEESKSTNSDDKDKETSKNGNNKAIPKSISLSQSRNLSFDGHLLQKIQQSRSQKPIDFTADISIDQPGEYMTDEEIMNHLDEIENIVLDGTSFELQDEAEQTNSSLPTPVVEVRQTEADEEQPKTQEIKPAQEEEKEKTIIEEKDPKESPNETTVNKEEDKSTVEVEPNTDWYGKKLETKVATVKDRLSKLARVLEFSYPRYKGWLDRNEATVGTPVCRLEEPRRCSLEKPHTNRWKFMCNRKPVQESTEKQNANKEETSGNSDSTMWRLTPTGVWDSNTDNSSEYPPFVMKAVKVFEDFLQTSSSSDELPPQPSSETTPGNNEVSKSEEASACSDADEKENVKQQWLWLLVRCNRADELMLYATGKNIKLGTMDALKQVYEIGPGKDCQVKSLYCKSITKVGGTTSTDTTFLLGSEALDEVVGGIKIQLAPKTNFWSNAAGAESLGNAVADLLSPTPKTTVVEIGCGTGLIGLMLASKCHQVIGLDSPSEVEEAEMTSELNGVKNASFVMGEPTEVMATIAKVLSNCKAAAIVNTNTNIGRAIEVMTDLRKIISLKRLVMVTTLTKQSVRSILELTRPGDHALGNPFIPIKACVVDTLPIGPHFEVVILMERRVINKFPRYWINPVKSTANSTQQLSVGGKGATTSSTKSANSPAKKDKQNLNKPLKVAEQSVRKNFDKQLEPFPKKAKFTPGFGKKAQFLANKQLKDLPPPSKNKFKMKRNHSPQRSHIPPKKFANRFDKSNLKPWAVDNRVSPEQKPLEDKRLMNKFDDTARKNVHYRSRSPVTMKDQLDRHKSRGWSAENMIHHGSPNRDKRFRDHKDQSDLRERLSGNRIEPEIMEKVKKQQQMLDMAKQKLSGPSTTVDVATAKQLQSMLNMVLEQTNKLQSQLPRSVWDRIAPPENSSSSMNMQSQNDPLLKGRYVQEMGTQDILITTANREFIKPNEPMSRGNYDRFNTGPPPRNTLMPSTSREDSSLNRFQNPMPDRYHGHNVNYHKQQQEQESQWDRDKRGEKNRWEPFQPMRKNSSPTRKPVSPLRQPMPAMGRPVSPRRVLSPHRRPLSPSRRQISPLRRNMSPLRRQTSPGRRQLSPSRRQMSPSRRQGSPTRRQISPSRRQNSPSRGVMSPPKHLLSPSRRHLSPMRRQMSPSRRVDDEWDIPSRGAIEQNTWQRPSERIPEKRWHDDRQPSMNVSSWDHSGNNDRYRKTVNQDKWDIKDASHDAIWSSGGGGDTWASKPSSAAPNKDHWQSSSENRWPSSSGGPNEDNWNIRGKESFAKPQMREESKPIWSDNSKPRWGDQAGSAKDTWGQADKEDWNDLPDDAKDPWGDDGNNSSKDRWLKYDNNSGPSSGWSRDNQIGDSWQNKSAAGAKSQWQSSSANQLMNEPRWSCGDGAKKGSMSGDWQGSSGATNNWPSQNYSGFQQSRSYNPGSFKDRR